MSPADAKAMLDAGADLLQLYTGYIYEGPGLVGEICRSLIADAEAAAAGTETAETAQTQAAALQNRCRTRHWKHRTARHDRITNRTPARNSPHPEPQILP